MLKGIAQKNQALLDKINNGQKITQKEIAEIEAMKKTANENLLKTAELLKNKLGTDGAQSFMAYVNEATATSCVCTAYQEEKPKRGPSNEYNNTFVYYDEDCKTCLAAQTQKQLTLQQANAKAQAILKEKMVCGCMN